MVGGGGGGCVSGGGLGCIQAQAKDELVELSIAPLAHTTRGCEAWNLASDDITPSSPPIAEWNIFADPSSAMAMYAAQWAIVDAPLDVAGSAQIDSPA